MRTTTLLMAAGALIVSPATILARPGQGGGAGPSASMGRGPMSPPTTHTSQGSTNGTGWNHTNGPTHATGQPNQSCETTGTTPGRSASAPGSAFNPEGKAGTQYAGEKPQNSRNTASVSQYDVACANQPH
jgi:hypothetical protein